MKVVAQFQDFTILGVMISPKRTEVEVNKNRVNLWSIEESIDLLSKIFGSCQFQGNTAINRKYLNFFPYKKS